MGAKAIILNYIHAVTSYYCVYRDEFTIKVYFSVSHFGILEKRIVKY